MGFDFKLSQLSGACASYALGATGPARWLGFAPAAVDNGIEAFFAFSVDVGQSGLASWPCSDPGG